MEEGQGFWEKSNKKDDSTAGNSWNSNPKSIEISGYNYSDFRLLQ